MRVKIACLVAVVVLVAGCASPNDDQPGGNQTSGTSGPPGSDVSETRVQYFNVTIVNRTFQPNNFAVASNKSIQFANPAAEVHGILIVDSNGAVIVDEDILPGRTLAVGNLGSAANVYRSEAGSYPLRCRYHSQTFHDGMSGLIQVTT
jgi:plastocyanin